MRDEAGLTRGVKTVKGRVDKHRGHPEDGLNMTAVLLSEYLDARNTYRWVDFFFFFLL